MKAVVLAGGLGTRLAPYTMVLPKPLVPVGGVPILETVLRQLCHHGFQDVTLAVGYLSPLIRAYLDLSPLSKKMRLAYHQEREPLGTAGALASIEGLDEPFLAMNGDLLTTVSYSEMMHFHIERDAALTIAVTDRRIQVEVGVLGIDSKGRIVSYSEKPVHSYPASMGIYICSPRILAKMKPHVRLDIPDLVLQLIDAGEVVAAYRSDARWLDIGNPTDHALASEAFDRDRRDYLPDEI